MTEIACTCRCKFRAPEISHVTNKNKRIIAEISWWIVTSEILYNSLKSALSALICVILESYFYRYRILSGHKSRSPYDVCMHCPYEEHGPTAGAKPRYAQRNSGTRYPFDSLKRLTASKLISPVLKPFDIEAWRWSSTYSGPWHVTMVL
jgi:hypothetical protein